MFRVTDAVIDSLRDTITQGTSSAVSNERLYGRVCNENMFLPVAGTIQQPILFIRYIVFSYKSIEKIIKFSDKWRRYRYKPRIHGSYLTFYASVCVRTTCYASRIPPQIVVRS